MKCVSAGLSGIKRFFRHLEIARRLDDPTRQDAAAETRPAVTFRTEREGGRAPDRRQLPQDDDPGRLALTAPWWRRSIRPACALAKPLRLTWTDIDAEMAMVQYATARATSSGWSRSARLCSTPSIAGVTSLEAAAHARPSLPT